ncbi:MAG TPA: hypothetical protein DEO94_00305, partial [Cyanobacteria bacterium UBA11991]|nr:hypothetical protein [Cyanobacteria bacterium UBA11991]
NLSNLISSFRGLAVEDSSPMALNDDEPEESFTHSKQLQNKRHSFSIDKIRSALCPHSLLGQYDEP